MLTDMKLEKIENKSFRQNVYEKPKEKMITAEIFPGEYISVRNLAKRLGVNLMQMSEALWQMESKGAMIIEVNRGLRFSNLAAKDFQ